MKTSITQNQIEAIRALGQSKPEISKIFVACSTHAVIADPEVQTTATFEICGDDTLDPNFPYPIQELSNALNEVFKRKIDVIVCPPLKPAVIRGGDTILIYQKA